MPICVPIKDMRDTAKFSELVETAPGPVTVTKNGYSKFVVMRSEDYDQLEGERAKVSLLSRMTLAEHERAEGESRDAFESLADIRKRYGL